jgi:hypothetical protein
MNARLRMKKLIFVLIINSVLTKASAQNQLDTDDKNVQQNNCAFIKPNTLINADTGTASKTLLEVKRITVKYKKHFIRKMLANYQGVDFRNAWSNFSLN